MMKFMQDGNMTGMSQEAQLAAIAATLAAMDTYIGRELREIKDKVTETTVKHASEIESLRVSHALEMDKLKEAMKVERETRLRYESQGKGILIAVGGFAALVGAVSDSLWGAIFGTGV